MEADAMFELAKLYRDAGDLVTADARATQGLASSQRVGDRYYVPRNLTVLADLKARQGRNAEANALGTLPVLLVLRVLGRQITFQLSQ